MADNMPTSDSDYDVISAMDHLLHGAETADRYCNDAESFGDRELAGFSREGQTSNSQLADKVRTIQKNRLQ